MKLLHIAICIVLCCLALVGHTKTQVITNGNDSRKFEYFVLDNQLKVLLIADDQAEKAAAAMDVAVGSSDDPNDRFGLAHFLEHMLFLGTQKYPTTGGFQDYVYGHGGEHNAYTSLENTNYFFDVDADAFEHALDRFSQFFIAPLLLPENVDRERNAVHSEYASKLKSESRRERDVLRELVGKDHPLGKFSTGNVETLSGVSALKLRTELVNFYREKYSANRMVLVVTGPFELEQLKSWVIEKFSAIENKKLSPPPLVPNLFPENFLPAKVYVKPQKELHKLTLVFPVTPTNQHLPQRPLQYIGNFIGHEGQGSLLSLLKQSNWATALSAGTGIRWHGGETFAVNIHLTKKGFSHLNEVYTLVFDYLDLLRRKGVKRWRYEELAKLSKMFFDYGERGDSIHEVSLFASELHETAAENLLWKSFNWGDFNRGLIHRYLKQLNKENVFSLVVAPNVKTDKVSQFYSAPYRVVANSGITADDNTANPSKYTSLKKKLRLPRANPFVPPHFKIAENKKGMPEGKERQEYPMQEDLPRRIYKRKNINGWFLNDNIYDIPKGFVSARYLLPVAGQSPEGSAALRIYVRMMRDSLNQISYIASLAGLSFSISTTSRGIDIDFHGYNSSLPGLSERVLRVLRKFNERSSYRKLLTEYYFDNVKKELLRQQRNKRHDKVYSQVFSDLPSVLYSPYWSTEDTRKALETLTKERFLELSSQFFKGAHMDALVFGNFRVREARKHIVKLGNVLKRRGKQDIPKGKVAKLAGLPTLFRHLEVDSDESVSVIYIQGRDDSLQERAKMLVLQKMISSPFYQTLRTEQQLGYIVLSANYLLRDVPGMVAVVQSPAFSPDELYEKMTKFFRDEKAEVLKNFTRDKQAVLIGLKEQPKNQVGWADRYWNSILNKDFSFSDDTALIRAVSELNKDELEAMYDELLIKKAADLIYTASRKEVNAQNFKASVKPVESYRRFKNTAPTYVFE